MGHRRGLDGLPLHMVVPTLTALFHDQVSQWSSDPAGAHAKLDKALDDAVRKAERMLRPAKSGRVASGVFARAKAAAARLPVVTEQPEQ